MKMNLIEKRDEYKSSNIVQPTRKGQDEWLEINYDAFILLIHSLSSTDVCRRYNLSLVVFVSTTSLHGEVATTNNYFPLMKSMWNS